MNNNQGPQKLKSALGLSALTLGLWFGGTAQSMAAQSMAASADGAGASAKHKNQHAAEQNPEIVQRLRQLNRSSHSYPPQKISRNHRNSSNKVFQYSLLDTKNFQPNVFMSKIEGINDTAEPPAGDHTVGIARMVVSKKEGITEDPNDPHSHIGIYVDVSGLKTIHSESGWYEASFLYTTKIPPIAQARPDGYAQFGTMTPEDAAIMSAMGAGNNGVVGNHFTVFGNEPRWPASHDVWPWDYSNMVPFAVTAGTFNALQGNDAHSYFEFRPETNMVFPHVELPFTGGVPVLHMPNKSSFNAGLLGSVSSLIPGSGTKLDGLQPNDPVVYGDAPRDPRDPDRFEAGDPSQVEFRLRSVPSGLTEELHRDVFIRRASFMPEEKILKNRLAGSLKRQYSLIDKNGDGVLSYAELDIDGHSDGLPNTRLYFPITKFDRFVIQREINDGYIAPRFSDSQLGYVLSGDMKTITGDLIKTPGIENYNASISVQDGDDNQTSQTSVKVIDEVVTSAKDESRQEAEGAAIISAQK